MERFQDMLLAVWREACKHINIEESVETLTEILQDAIPLEHVVVGKFDFTAGRVEPVAVSGRGAGCPFPHTVNLDKQKAGALRSWCRSGSVVLESRAGERNDIIAAMAPERPVSDVIAGPLIPTRGLGGFLLLLSERGHRFDALHLELAGELLEPFSTVLNNDLMIRKIDAMREAAEADKRRLLTRLGRKEIGDSIVGVESGLCSVMKRVEMASPLEVPVMIFGETGSGKELIARAIHRGSPRSGQAFIRVNCGAIPSNLIDSELFGHEKGAFTGAVNRRRGWFERADGGTLFLDEIGDLPLAAQVRMLRVLQDGWLERVGGQQQIHVDIRIVAATHRDLSTMVESGEFREDLWYRLMVFPVIIPPLRERKEDIPDMVLHFAGRAATRFGLSEVEPKRSDIALLQAYDWPGNVRELAAVVDRAAILGNGTSLDFKNALGAGTETVWRGAGRKDESAGTEGGESSSTGTIRALNEVLKQHIEHALLASGGRIEGPRGCAAMLDIHPSTLRAKMRTLGIHRRDFTV